MNIPFQGEFIIWNEWVIRTFTHQLWDLRFTDFEVPPPPFSSPSDPEREWGAANAYSSPGSSLLCSDTSFLSEMTSHRWGGVCSAPLCDSSWCGGLTRRLSFLPYHPIPTIHGTRNVSTTGTSCLAHKSLQVYVDYVLLLRLNLFLGAPLWLAEWS